MCSGLGLGLRVEPLPTMPDTLVLDSIPSTTYTQVHKDHLPPGIRSHLCAPSAKGFFGNIALKRVGLAAV